MDTATESIAVGLQGPAVTLCRVAPGGAAASAGLLPLIHALLAEAGMSLDHLDLIAFGHGPGAFTGLRTACAVAQGLAFGLGKLVLPIDSLMIVAEDARRQASELLPGSDRHFEVGVAMDARMDEVYAARYAWDGAGWLVLQAPALWTLPALSAAWAGAELDAVAGSALRAFGGRWQPAPGALALPDELQRAAALLRLALQLAPTTAGIDPADAVPLYLRDKVAQTSAERAAARPPSPALQGAGSTRPRSGPASRPAAVSGPAAQEGGA